MACFLLYSRFPAFSERRITMKTQKKDRCRRLPALIYSVMVTAKEIAWYVNNQEVLRVPNTTKNTAFSPAMAAYLPDQAKAATGKVEVDWVKAYTYLTI